MNTSTPASVSVSVPVPVPVSVPVLSSTPTRPNTRFVKASDIRNLFEITKREYNDILVRINEIILNNFI